MTRLGDILLFGYFLLEQYLHFQLNKQLQNMVCCTYFNNQRELGVDVLEFQFELGYFGYSLGYISKYWANFCSIFWSLWLAVWSIHNFILSFTEKKDFVTLQLIYNLHKLYKSCRDSSVGRALDWRSKGPRFDPGSRHFFFKQACKNDYYCWYIN